MKEPIWRQNASKKQKAKSNELMAQFRLDISEGKYNELSNIQFNELISTEPYLMGLLRNDRLDLYREFRAHRLLLTDVHVPTY